MELRKSKGRQSVPRRTIAAALALTCLAFTANTYAFKQPIHEEITEEELSTLGFDELSCDEVGDSSYWTDLTEMLNEAAHVDNNRLDAGSARLRNKIDEVVGALQSCERRDALDALGAALHTVQDVFAHSNAVDNGHPVDLLGMANGDAFTCDAANNFAPAGLVSGYFSLGGFALGDQCMGMQPGRCCHRDLNKDDAGVPNGARFPLAAQSARAKTREYVQMVIDELHAKVGGDQATQLEKMLKERQRTMMFVIDDTGSMYTDIAGVRSAALSFVDGLIAGDEAPTLGLVSFKDSANDRGEFCDVDQFRSAINSLYAWGGGDCPEASNTALLTALGKFPLISTDMQMRGGRILLATDASAGDAALGPLVAAQAAIKGVGIDAILTGDCYAEESASLALAGSTPFVPSDNRDGTAGPARAAMAPLATIAAKDPLTSRSARTQLKALTAQTGGVLFNVTRYEVDDVVPTLLELSAPDSALVRGWRISKASGAIGDVEIPVDESFQGKISFMVTASTSTGLPSFTLLDPAGNVVNATTPGVTRLKLSSVDKYTVTTPMQGTWRIRFPTAGDFVVRAFGQSALLASDIRLLDPAVPPVTPDIDLMPVEGQPVIGKELVVDVGVTAAVASVDAVAVRAENGTLLQTLFPSMNRARSYRVAFVPPAQPFLLEVAGTSVGGAGFARQTALPVRPQAVALSVFPKTAMASAGSAADIDVTVTNASGADAVYT